MKLKGGYSYEGNGRDTAWDVEDVQVRLSHVVWAENGERGRAYIQVDVAHVLVLLLSSSRSSLVVVSVSVPTSDSVRARAG